MHGVIREIGSFSFNLQNLSLAEKKNEEMSTDKGQVGRSFTNPIRRHNNACLGQPCVHLNGSQLLNKVRLQAHSF